MSYEMSNEGLFGKLKSIFWAKNLDDNATAKEKFSAAINSMNLYSYFMGTELTNKWYFSRRTLNSVIMVSCCWWGVAYSCYAFGLTYETVVLIGGACFTITTTTKLLYIVVNHHRFLSSLNCLFNLFKMYSAGERERILSSTATSIVRQWKYTLTGLVTGVSIYAFYPTYDLIFNGNLTLVAPMIYPLLDAKTPSGYTVLTSINVVFAFWAIGITYEFNCLFLTNVGGYDGMVGLVEDDFKLFDNLCNKEGQEFVEKRSQVFRNILIELMDIANFCGFMSNLYDSVATVQIIGCFIGTVTVLFGYLANEYISGIGGAIYFMTELLMFCYIGQLMQNTSDRVVTVMYNTKWYFYEIKYQKSLALALHILQCAQPIQIAYIYPLNFETGSMIVNNMYSVFMMMLNFIE